MMAASEAAAIRATARLVVVLILSSLHISFD
jgi:hypothetical protein